MFSALPGYGATVSGADVYDAFNPADFGPNTAVIVLSNSNRQATMNTAATGQGAIRGQTSRASGKVYLEFLINALDSVASASLDFGFATADVVLKANTVGSPSSMGTSYTTRANGQLFRIVNGSVGLVASPPTFAVGDVVGFAIDFSTGNAWLLVNNVSAEGSPSVGTSPFFMFDNTKTYLPMFASHNQGNSLTLRTQTASQSYTPPTGFNPWSA